MKSISVMLLAVFALAIGTARGDDPKSYRINLRDVRVESHDLAAGDYKLLLHRDESRVQIVELKTGRVFDVSATLETKDSKFDLTEIHTQQVNGVDKVTEIRIGGTRFLVNFRKPL